MKDPLPLDCRMDVSFRSPPNGRPGIYDFFWDAAPELYKMLNQKTVHTQVRRAPFSTPKKRSARANDNKTLIESFAQKFSRDTRFGTHAQPVQIKKKHLVDAALPTAQLEHALSAYNILFEAGLEQTRLSSPELQIDFTAAGENKVRIRTNTKHLLRVKEFLAAHAHPKPHVHTLTFGANHPLQAHLSPRPAHGRN